MNKLEAAQEVQEELLLAIKHIRNAVAIMEYNGLNLEKYPKYWHDFAEHPDELGTMVITDFENISLQVQRD